MKNIFAIGIAGVGLSVAMLALGFYSGTLQARTPVDAPSAARMTGPLPRAEIETIVREYLLANPEMLTEMQASLEDRQQEAERVAQLETIRGASGDIFDAAHDGIVGNPEGSVTVVEFFDYNCGFCKRALADMEAMVAADDDLRFVLKEFPILGPDSQRAHIVSMAFRALMPEKYGDFHRQLLGAPGRASEDEAMKVAISLGADEAALREEMKNPDIAAAFSSTYELANRLAITGTPSYVIGEEVVFGALGQAVLAEKVAIARE